MVHPGSRGTDRRRRGRDLVPVPDRLGVESQRGDPEDDRRQACWRWVVTPKNSEFGIRTSEFRTHLSPHGLEVDFGPPGTRDGCPNSVNASGGSWGAVMARATRTPQRNQRGSVAVCGQPSRHAGRVPHKGPKEDRWRLVGQPSRLQTGASTAASANARHIRHEEQDADQNRLVGQLSWYAERSASKGPRDHQWRFAAAVMARGTHPLRTHKRTGGGLRGSRPGCQSGWCCEPAALPSCLPTGGPQGRTEGWHRRMLDEARARKRRRAQERGAEEQGRPRACPINRLGTGGF